MRFIPNKILIIPPEYLLIISFVLILSFSQGVAQKVASQTNNLEINNLLQHTTTTLFDPNQRINPSKNLRLKKSARQTSVKMIQLVADEYLRHNKEILDIKDIDRQLHMDIILRSPAGSHIHYQEMMNDIPVYDSKIVITINQFNEV